MSLFNNHPAYYQVSSNTKVDPRSMAMLTVWGVGTIFVILPAAAVVFSTLHEFLNTGNTNVLFVTGVSASILVGSVLGTRKVAHSVGGVKKKPKLAR
ncbi:hypothetical protein [Burkholderia contaminans]|uniref:hypothetical protein n=1 Tax=Burkholderia contaminans TaxID=488447 RepID=UPI00158E9A35|nr:hypothetical protein [Burkholderia contaminans]